MADKNVKREEHSRAMNWEPFFFVLNRVNAVLIFCLAVIFTLMLGSQVLLRIDESDHWTEIRDEDGYGSEYEPANSIIGQSVNTSAGEFVAYYENDESYEREELAGLTIVSPKTGKTLPIAAAGEELLVSFEFLFEKGDDENSVIGYIARTASEANYRAGKSDLIIGGLPAMTKNVVARDVRFVDLPQVRSDGILGAILWQTDDRAELVGFRLNDGSVVDRATIELPAIREDRVSQGPGRATDPALLRDSSFGKAPRNGYAF